MLFHQIVTCGASEVTSHLSSLSVAKSNHLTPSNDKRRGIKLPCVQEVEIREMSPIHYYDPENHLNVDIKHILLP